MSIFANAIQSALPPDPRNLIEGQVTSTITSGISFGSDPANTVRNTVQNVQGINANTANTLGPNFDRFSVPESPQAFGVVGNLFQSGQDLVPMSNILSNFGGTFIGDELSQVNVSNLLENPGAELSTLARNLSNSVSNQARQGANSLARSVVQDVKDIFRGAVNSILNPAAAGTTNLGVTDSRLSYAFYGPRDASPKYSKGKSSEAGTDNSPVGFKGVEPILNPHYVFRLNLVANGMTSGDESLAQSRLLLDKESRMGVSSVGKKEVTLSAILSRFGGFSQKNPTPYRAADFLWLKHYNRIPLTRLITLRRYMFPIQDNLTRSAFLGSGTSGGSWRFHGWSNNPVSQMVTYFGGDSGNDLSSILKIAVSSSWKDSEKSAVKDIKLNDGKATDLFTLFESSRVAQLAASGTKALGNIVSSKILPSSIGEGLASFFNSTTQISKGSGLSQQEIAAGILGYVGLIDKARFSGLQQYLDLFNPYAHGGYLQDLYREPYNVIDQVKIRQPGLSGGLLGGSSVEIKFEYSLKSIGHINAKAAMLDIMANILATTHYRGNFWGGEARFYLNKGLFPMFDQKQTIQLVKNIWSGNFDGATTTFINIVKEAFGGDLPSVDAVAALLSGVNENTKTPTNSGDLDLNLPTKGSAITSTENASREGGFIPEKLKEMAGIDLLAGFFNLTGGDGNSSIPQFQALRTGAPVGEWHLTVGNPFKPIAVIGNLVCSGVEINFNDELGPDDFPTEMTATVSLSQGMSRANQDVESVFNDGFGPLYIPRPDLFAKDGKDFDRVKEEISKQVARQGIFDFMQLLPESTIESVSNFTSISANPTEELPSAHINTTFQPPAQQYGPPGPQVSS
jgi:hypothetical protein